MHVEDLKIREFIDSVGAKTPTPGGGSVAAVVAALSAALSRMVVQFSLDKDALKQYHSVLHDSLKEFEQLSRTMLRLADDDAAAYAKLNELWKLDKNDDRRGVELPKALERAINVPLSIIDSSQSVLRILQTLQGKVNMNLRSDLAMAAILAETAVRSAAWNVRVNLPMLNDRKHRKLIEDELNASLNHAATLFAKIEKTCLTAKP